MNRKLVKKYMVAWLCALVFLISGSVAIADSGEAAITVAPRQCIEPPPAQHLGPVLDLLQRCSGEALWQSYWRLAALVEEIARVRFDGLSPQHYYLTELTDALHRLSKGQPLSICETRLATWAYLSALHDLHFGRVDPAASGLIWYAPGAQRERSVDELRLLAEDGWDDLRATFALARPSLPQYQNLRSAYRRALITMHGDWPLVPEGGLLQQGDVAPRVVALRQRLRALNYLPSLQESELDRDIFDDSLRDALQAFQLDHNLQPDGKLGPATLVRINIPAEVRLAAMRVNLERMRWLARDLEPDSLVVDIAGARVTYIRDGQQRWSGKAQMGKPGRPTPVLKSSLSYVTLNPMWTVPPTILKEDVLPGIAANPDYLQERRIRVYDYQGEELEPAAIDWASPGRILLRQDAGPGNALGRVVIRFPNPYGVYLHDTPSIALFDSLDRFYSSGCVRVEHVMQLSELLFQDSSEKLVSDFYRIRDSGETMNLWLPQTISVLMYYWTAEASENGRVVYRPDVYQRDAVLLQLLEQPAR